MFPMEPKRVREAIYAIMRAASDSPHDGNQSTFWEYQRRVMEPLRANLRDAYEDKEQEAA